jgi:hypothetical protein
VDRFSETSPIDLVNRRRLHLMGDDERIYSEPLECGSCSSESPELFPCYWEPKIQVGSCCLIHPDDIPSEPLCAVVPELAKQATSIGQFLELLKAHMVTCAECKEPPRKEPRSETSAASDEQKGIA